MVALALGWAYRRRPLATAFLVLLLFVPLGVTLDSGNVTLLLAMAIWAAQFAPPVAAGGLWALAASMKWYPALFLGILPMRARRWGVALVAVAILLSIAMWPQTVIQIQAVIGDPRPSRIDYLLLLLAAVPWVWRHERLAGRTWPAGRLDAGRGRAHQPAPLVADLAARPRGRAGHGATDDPGAHAFAARLRLTQAAGIDAEVLACRSAIWTSNGRVSTRTRARAPRP